MFQGNGKIKILIDYIVSFLNFFDARWSGNYQHMQKYIIQGTNLQL